MTFIPMEDKSIPTCVWFSGAWEQVVGPVSPTIYAAGVHLLEQGSDSSGVYCVRKGLIKLQSINSAGRQTIVGLRRAGCLLGVEAAILGQPHLVSAITVTECCLERFPVRQFCELICKHPNLSWRLLQITANDLREATAALAELKAHTANIRLKRLVLDFVTEVDLVGLQNIETRLPFRHWEIAQILGVTPEHLSRLLRRLEKEGFLGRKCRTLAARINARRTSPRVAKAVK